MPSVVLSTPWPVTVDALLVILDIQGGADIRCHGTKKSSKDKCRTKVSKESWAAIQRFLSEVVAEGAWASSRALLQKVSQLVMCRSYHQDQGPALLSVWETRFKTIQPTAVLNSPVDESSDDTLVKDEPDLEVKPIRALSEIPIKTSAIETPKPLAEIPEKPKEVHSFVPFGPPVTTRTTNEAIKKLVLKPLTPADLNSRRHGSVYIYTFPSLYRTPAPYLKIGHTKSVEARMKRWEAQCHYEPKILSTFNAEFYVKIERLVHKQLRNNRLREPECPGCGKPHIEWFQVRSNKASSLVALWTDWTRQQPYDDHGVLKDSWRKRLSKVDVNDPDCWEDFVNVEEELSEEEEEEEDDDDASGESVYEESDFEDESEDEEVLDQYESMEYASTDLMPCSI